MNIDADMPASVVHSARNQEADFRRPVALVEQPGRLPGGLAAACVPTAAGTRDRHVCGAPARFLYRLFPRRCPHRESPREMSGRVGRRPTRRRRGSATRSGRAASLSPHPRSAATSLAVLPIRSVRDLTGREATLFFGRTAFRRALLRSPLMNAPCLEVRTLPISALIPSCTLAGPFVPSRSASALRLALLGNPPVAY